MKTITLADEQARLLKLYLFLTTNDRKNEFETCQRLAQEKYENGSPRFPNMAGNADWWKKAIAEIDEIQKVIDNVPCTGGGKMGEIYEQLKKDVAYAKTSVCPQYALHAAHGGINMARQLEAITKEQYLELNHECVAEGINNPKYFD